MEWVIGIATYVVMALLIGATAYWQLRGSKRRKNGSVLIGIFWPLVFGLFVISLIEDIRGVIEDAKRK